MISLKTAETPKCRVCGAKMTFASSGASGIIYACGTKAAKANLNHYWNSRSEFRGDEQMRLYYLELTFHKMTGEMRALRRQVKELERQVARK